MFLKRYGVVHGTVFDDLKLGLSQASRRFLLSRLQELGRSQQATYDALDQIAQSNVRWLTGKEIAGGAMNEVTWAVVVALAS